MAERRFWVYGPFEIPRSQDLLEVDKGGLRGLWEQVEYAEFGLAVASGCYVFRMRATSGSRPWYVGQAKVSFRQECFTRHKLNHYNSVIEAKRGIPILFLVARATPERGQFVRRLGRREAD